MRGDGDPLIFVLSELPIQRSDIPWMCEYWVGLLIDTNEVDDKIIAVLELRWFFLMASTIFTNQSNDFKSNRIIFARWL